MEFIFASFEAVCLNKEIDFYYFVLKLIAQFYKSHQILLFDFAR